MHTDQARRAHQGGHLFGLDSDHQPLMSATLPIDTIGVKNSRILVQSILTDRAFISQASSSATTHFQKELSALQRLKEFHGVGTCDA